MTAKERRAIRAKIKDGLYVVHTSCVLEVLIINEEDVGGIVRFTDYDNYEVGKKMNLTNPDHQDRFYSSLEHAINAYKMKRVRGAMNDIKRAKNTIERGESIIELYPEFAV